MLCKGVETNRKKSFSPMEIILMILGELEYLKNLMRLAKQKKDAEIVDNQVSMVSIALTFKCMCINKTHRS
jgi:hypothetical protein